MRSSKMSLTLKKIKLSFHVNYIPQLQSYIILKFLIFERCEICAFSYQNCIATFENISKRLCIFLIIFLIFYKIFCPISQN